MLQKGSTVEKANDGKYGTMVWRAAARKNSKEKPWVEINFPKPIEVNRFRFSSNREYHLETDYLEKMPGSYYPGFRVLALQDDGTWKTLAATQLARQSLKKDPQANGAAKRLQAHIATLREEGPHHSFIGHFTQPGPTKVLHRGSPENPRDEVPPAAFAIMEGNLGLNSSTKDPVRRKKFADWLTDPKHPLTARVMVNRIWHHLFGTGIVPTTADFGIAGAKPTHPELLDWLASEYIDNGWSTKAMIKQIMLTQAFRRSSLPESNGMQKDANSSLLWRFPPRRVEAEVIRDGILQASGKLDPKIGGRSFRIHNVKKTYAQWEVTDNYGPDTWRRMIYKSECGASTTRSLRPSTFQTADKSAPSVPSRPPHFRLSTSSTLRLWSSNPNSSQKEPRKSPQRSHHQNLPTYLKTPTHPGRKRGSQNHPLNILSAPSSTPTNSPSCPRKLSREYAAD